MSDTTQHDSMYCHGCHHQWQREGESIECPSCRSSSTEIVTSDDDPLHFHGRHAQPAEPTSTAPAVSTASAPVYGPELPPAHPQAQTSQNAAPNAGPTSQETSPHGPTTQQFIFAPITFHFTIFTDGVRPQPPSTAPQETQAQPQPETGHPQPQAANWFGMHFFTPRFHAPPPPPPTGANSPPAASTEAVAASAESQPHPETGHPQPQQSHAGPHMASGIPGGFMTALIASLFDPTALSFGDAVYSQEALDRIITQLREANANSGGAAPASQAAIDKLQTKEVDDDMLGSAGEDSKPKCVICVDDMVMGEQAAILPCSHLFHGECVTPWLKLHNTCPVCRRSIEEEVHEKPVKTVDELHLAQQHQHEQHHENAPSSPTGCM